LVLLAAAGGIGLVGVVLARPAPWRSPELALVLVLAVWPPIALLLYSLLGPDLFVYPRNLSAALPFAGLALGWLLTRPAPPLAAAAVGLAAVAIVAGATMTRQERFHRPNSPALARALDDRLKPGGAVVYYGSGLDPLIMANLLGVYLREHHPVAGAADTVPSLRHALAAADEGEGAVPLALFKHDEPPPVAPGWDQLGWREFVGHPTLILASYTPLSEERYRGLRLAPGRVVGAVDSAVREPGTLNLSGWALTRGARPPAHLLAFVGGRLVAAGVPNRARPDAAKAHGAPTDEVGFMIALPASLDRAARRSIRVFATRGQVESQLPRYCSEEVRVLLGC
jgi:hypothetical protein